MWMISICRGDGVICYLYACISNGITWTFHYLICLKGSILDYKVLPRGDQKLNGHKGETVFELPEWQSLIYHFILHSHQGTAVVQWRLAFWDCCTAVAHQGIMVCTLVCFCLYYNFFLRWTNNKVLIETCLLELRLEILGFGQRVLDVKLLFLVTYTPN